MKFLITLLLPFISHSQIIIPDVGEGWKNDVDSAIKIIQKYDSEKYKLLTETCTNIEFWNGDYSTIDGSNTITISTKDLKRKSINNICCILVHESLHLYIRRLNFKIERNTEEIIAYTYELEFLKKLPN